MGMTITTRVNLTERFWSKVLRTTDSIQCWNWIGTTNHRYGVMRINGKQKLAHRIAYELVKGNIPNNMELDHLCHNTLCVNPSHLEAVLHGENMRRGLPHYRHNPVTHCIHGHLFDKYNTRYWDKNSTHRYCLACHRERSKKRREVLWNAKFKVVVETD